MDKNIETVEQVLFKLVLEQNSELIIIAHKIISNTGFLSVGDKINVEVNADKLPHGFKFKNSSWGFIEDEIIVVNKYRAEPYLTRLKGWVSDKNKSLSEIIPIEVKE